MSDIHYNAENIFEIAVQIERNGAKFYRKAAESEALAEHKELLLRLAEMEVGHEEIFTELKDKLIGSTNEDWMYLDPGDLAGSYLRAVADGYVFPVNENPADRLSGKETIQEVLTAAIGAEKDSIVFYLGMKEQVPDEDGKSHIDKIIHEEMGHIVALSRHLEKQG